MTTRKTTKAGARTHTILTPRTDFEKDASEGARFWLGPIQRTHTLGEYQFIEYKERGCLNSDPKNIGTIHFSGYINGRGTRQSSRTLEGAIAHSIAYKQLGPNSQAGELFMVMVGIMEAKAK